MNLGEIDNKLGYFSESIIIQLAVEFTHQVGSCRLYKMLELILFKLDRLQCFLNELQLCLLLLLRVLQGLHLRLLCVFELSYQL